MKYNNVSLPYPVLGINDDVFPLLQDDCIQMADPIKCASEYLFSIDLVQRNEQISQLIRVGQAEYACEVECKDTYLRRCYHSVSPHFDIRLSRKEVCGRINFTCFVAAKSPIKSYTNKQFNEDYRGFTFDLEEGDMLVLFPMAGYNTNVRYDKLFAAGSFMQIVEAASGIEKTWFNLDTDRIQIELPHELFEKYQQVGNCFPEIIHSSVVHNALVYALANLEDERYEGKLWSDSIRQRIQTEPQLQQFDLENIKDVFMMADQLLQDPYKRLLEGLEKINHNSGEEE